MLDTALVLLNTLTLVMENCIRDYSTLMCIKSLKLIKDILDETNDTKVCIFQIVFPNDLFSF